MLMKKLAFGLALLATTACIEPAAAATYVEDYASIPASTVRVLARQGAKQYFGSGWVIAGADAEKRAGAGVVVTAYHVVAGATEVRIIEPGGDRTVLATVIRIDRQRDLAFLEVRGLGAPPLTLSSAPMKVGAPLQGTGYTGASDRVDVDGVARTASLKSGALSQAVKLGGPLFNGEPAVNIFEHSININPGYSGGPVVDQCGRVVGISLQDGGHLDMGRAGSINLAQGVATAVAANEVIAAANNAMINPLVDNSVCSNTPPPPPPPPKPPIIDPDNKSGLEKLFEQMGAMRLALAGLAIAGLGVAGFALWRVTRGAGNTSGPTPGPVVQNTSAPPPPPSTQLLELSGTGPAGEPINLSYRPAALSGKGIKLGRSLSSCPEGHIPDQRANPFVSGEHAKLIHDGQNFLVEDFKSTNKTLRNGQQVSGTAQVLNDGDILQLADVKLTVRIR